MLTGVETSWVIRVGNDRGGGVICGDTAADAAALVAGRSSRVLVEPTASRFATVATGLPELSVAIFGACLAAVDSGLASANLGVVGAGAVAAVGNGRRLTEVAVAPDEGSRGVGPFFCVCSAVGGNARGKVRGGVSAFELAAPDAV